jgi:hypothetical protein
MIHATEGKLHWNYFLALDRDLDVVSRYVEFCKPNYGVYSIELAHLLFAAASEVDVVAKLLCQRLASTAHYNNIFDYRVALKSALPDLPEMWVFVPRYGLSFRPWENWGSDRNPDWWDSYNKVKHQRDVHFEQATLKNALNALGALLIFTYHHYRYELAKDPGTPLNPRATTQQLQPEPLLLRLPDEYYQGHLLVNSSRLPIATITPASS